MVLTFVLIGLMIFLVLDLLAEFVLSRKIQTMSPGRKRARLIKFRNEVNDFFN